MMFCMTWFVTVLLPLYMRRRESTTSRGMTLLNRILMVYDKTTKKLARKNCFESTYMQLIAICLI